MVEHNSRQASGDIEQRLIDVGVSSGRIVGKVKERRLIQDSGRLTLASSNRAIEQSPRAEREGGLGD